MVNPKKELTKVIPNLGITEITSANDEIALLSLWFCFLKVDEKLYAYSTHGCIKKSELYNG